MVGKNIKKAREEKGLTQEQLAERLSVTRQAVSNWENEKTQPDIDTLHKISDTLEVNIEQLIYGKERKYTVEKHVHVQKTADVGAMVGAALAVVISYTKWQSIGWAILHGLLNWVYVIYYIIQYGWS
ncbi:MAG: helix-turn-helix domain-containing protein [Clostridia bacterium]|nr:helix-turn-helix domain-containing protein [Clostridia bacterium]